MSAATAVNRRKVLRNSQKQVIYITCIAENMSPLQVQNEPIHGLNSTMGALWYGSVWLHYMFIMPAPIEFCRKSLNPYSTGKEFKIIDYVKIELKYSKKD